MLPDDPKEWLARARSNLLQARSLQPGVYLEDLCFQAQQATEKALEALLLTRSGSFPYTHDLAHLTGLIEEAQGRVPDHIREVARLTDYAVEARYPGVSEPVERDEYEAAVALADGAVAWVERQLTREDQQK